MAVPKKKPARPETTHICLLCGEATGNMLKHIKERHDQYYVSKSKKGAAK